MDMDKYLILIYLVQKSFRHYADILIIHSEEQFYTKEEFEIEKINLIEISDDLSIAKETVRRKINELNEDQIIMRKGKKNRIKTSNICSSKTQTFSKNIISIFACLLKIFSDTRMVRLCSRGKSNRKFY